MEEVLFHATLISDISDHLKFMDTDFVYEAFMSWRGLDVIVVVVAAAIVSLIYFFFFFSFFSFSFSFLFFSFLFFSFFFSSFLSDPQIDNAKQRSFALITIVNWT